MSAYNSSADHFRGCFGLASPYAGLMQADAYAGFGKLYQANRKGGPIVEAACWAHGRRKFFDLARLSKAPIAAEAVIVEEAGKCAPALEYVVHGLGYVVAAREFGALLAHPGLQVSNKGALKSWRTALRFSAL